MEKELKYNEIHESLFLADIKVRENPEKGSKKTDESTHTGHQHPRTRISPGANEGKKSERKQDEWYKLMKLNGPRRRVEIKKGKAH